MDSDSLLVGSNCLVFSQFDRDKTQIFLHRLLVGLDAKLSHNKGYQNK